MEKRVVQEKVGKTFFHLFPEISHTPVDIDFRFCQSSNTRMSNEDNPNYGLNSNTVTLTQAAESLGVTTKTIRNWEEKGLIETIRTPGGHRRVPRSEIDRISKGTPEVLMGSEQEETIMAPPVSETEPVLTPNEYEQFLKAFGLDSVDCLQIEKSDIELLPEVGLGANINRDHTNVLIRQITHTIEKILNTRITDDEHLRMSNIISAAHNRGLATATPANKKLLRPTKASGASPGVPDNKDKTLGYLQD